MGIECPATIDITLCAGHLVPTDCRATIVGHGDNVFASLQDRLRSRFRSTGDFTVVEEIVPANRGAPAIDFCERTLDSVMLTYGCRSAKELQYALIASMDW